jgi:hypothetical protein
MAKQTTLTIPQCDKKHERILRQAICPQCARPKAGAFSTPQARIAKELSREKQQKKEFVEWIN